MNETDTGWEREIASVSVFETQTLSPVLYMDTAAAEACRKFQKIGLNSSC